jgi:hypothetical protein
MDSVITAAARALAAGDPLTALNRVALRDDAPAMALRGIAMAQLGDFPRARTLLRGAGRAFGSRDALARARCVLAEAEIALVSRDLAWPEKPLNTARATLEAHGDSMNAAHAWQLDACRLLLMGRLDDAERVMATIDPMSLMPASRAAHELAIAGIAMRRIHTKVARDALVRAARAARNAGIPALMAEVESAASTLDAPAARLIVDGDERLLRLDEVEAVLGTAGLLIVDACRHVVTDGDTAVSLATRPVLFSLVRILAEAWPTDVPRDVLIERAFRTRHGDETHRVRLRVEIGRLRRALHGLAGINATSKGFLLSPGLSAAPRRLPTPSGVPNRSGAQMRGGTTTQGGVSSQGGGASIEGGARKVVVLARPVEEPHAAMLALLADGESWSSSALALALGASQRTVQRTLETLASQGKAQFVGHGRARRWMVPAPPGYTTTLLLPVPMPAD